MNWLFVTLTVAVVIASVFLTIVVLLQNGKGDGLASNFVSANQTLGVRQTADLLEKVTWVLVSFILVVSILTTFSLGKNDSATDITDRIENAATEQQLEFPSTPIQSANPSSEAPATEAPSTEAN
ncbi:MAG: preprotein translocase subunit SecG [Bacteroidales bacterium]|jgi:preprotein translocase subunit SecG|nr:preprotein translocase subunit SecG [Bacteroidales bacterium]MBQ9173336.1 preprotein translocase subunit SecG [Bacteroidales bacterium]MBQ9711184.1 preprotein translocase subunit SecG [Bacteroidales bacterium]MBR1435677.1 preprotein translocase subunit SecG [Bacteroidales bacterium]MBR6415981.1 preprotein translocase subunit SecG [Bacteroidales bacterium]